MSYDWTEAWRTLSDGQSHSVSDSFNTSTTGGSPIRMAITSNPYGMNTAAGSIESFRLHMEAFSFARDLREGDMEIATQGTHIRMLASATTRFQLNARQMAITLNSFSQWNYNPNEQDMQVILNDLTATTTLLNREHLDVDGELVETYRLDMDPTHEYELILSGWVYAYDAKMVHMNMEIGIAEFSIPEPRSTALLLALSLTVLLWARRGRLWRLFV